MQPTQIAAIGLMGSAGHVDRQAKHALKNAGTADVVAVLVRNDERIDLADVAVMGCHSLFSGFSAYAGIEQ